MPLEYIPRSFATSSDSLESNFYKWAQSVKKAAYDDPKFHEENTLLKSNLRKVKMNLRTGTVLPAELQEPFHALQRVWSPASKGTKPSIPSAADCEALRLMNGGSVPKNVVELLANAGFNAALCCTPSLSSEGAKQEDERRHKRKNEANTDDLRASKTKKSKTLGTLSKPIQVSSPPSSSQASASYGITSKRTGHSSAEASQTQHPTRSSAALRNQGKDLVPKPLAAHQRVTEANASPTPTLDNTLPIQGRQLAVPSASGLHRRESKPVLDGASLAEEQNANQPADALAAQSNVGNLQTSQRSPASQLPPASRNIGDIDSVIMAEVCDFIPSLTRRITASICEQRDSAFLEIMEWMEDFVQEVENHLKTVQASDEVFQQATTEAVQKRQEARDKAEKSIHQFRAQLSRNSRQLGHTIETVEEPKIPREEPN
ncbi:hypothetical protein CTRI78_v008129 [Colletotrichum trifolii]|uniref:Uncharacterized protein n=1 Tax=Colletotrichum trifolii TaxID=5466 RepID=A0A4R8R5H2_COLTR|nr:hypothetical protein CTRI78_v008129 [Colletotrichum trifolii]